MPIAALDPRYGSRAKPTSTTTSVPAPVGGLNAVDSLASMPPTDAVIMDNIFPYPTYCQLRNGYSKHATGLPGWAETVMGYTSKTGTQKLFAISGTAVYDCTSAGAVGAAVVTGLTNARWEYTDVSTQAGSYLYAGNAVDKPLFYDGAAWVKVDAASTPAITGVTTTTLRNPTLWKTRLWWVQDNTCLAWYLAPNAIGGAATSFDLNTLFTLGGSLRTIMTFSISSATQFDDYIGFLSSQGELVVYQGTDPATNFTIVGKYMVGKPLGRRCWFRNGADACIISDNGVVSVSKAISVGVQQPDSAITYKILQLINADAQAYGSNFGWEGIVYPLGNKIILNVPQNSNAAQHQYVQNTIHGAWCSYGLYGSPWLAATFCTLGSDLYFGGNTYVALADDGQNDAGSQINGSIVPAFSYVGTPHQKRFTMCRPIMQATGAIFPTLSLNTDFNIQLPTGIPTYSAGTIPVWNVALWNVSYWATGPAILKSWQTVYGIGFTATVYMKIASTLSQVNLLSFDYVHEEGGTL